MFEELEDITRAYADSFVGEKVSELKEATLDFIDHRTEGDE